VDARAKPDVRVWIASDVHLGWVCKHGLVAVGRAKQRRDFLTLTNKHTANLNVGGCRALEQVKRRIESQKLVDRGGGNLEWSLAQNLQLVGPLHCGNQAVAEAIDTGLVTGIQ
jgi:hypothetical protein